MTHDRVPEPPPSRHSISGTHHIVLIDAWRTHRRIRRGWTLIVLPVLLTLVTFAVVRSLSRIERELASEGQKAARVVVYDVAPGGELRFPLEPRTDLLRIVVHAVGERACDAAAPHEALLTVSLRGDVGQRTESLRLPLASSCGRARAEERALRTADPIGVNVDCKGLGVGEASVRLEALTNADSLLMRVYRRESLRGSDAVRRSASIDAAKRAHLARRSGEIDWLDLGEAEQELLVESRWRKLAALPGEMSLVTRAIALAPAPQPSAAPSAGFLGRFAFEDGDRAAYVAHGPVTIRADAARGARIRATLRDARGAARELAGEGTLNVEVPSDAVMGVEIGVEGRGEVSLHSSDPTRIDAPMRVPYWRVTASHPAIVDAGDAGLVLRVSARRPMERAEATPFPIALSVVIRDAAGARIGDPSTFGARVARSHLDRYDEVSAAVAPSDRATLYVIVPSRGRAELSPVAGVADGASDGALDLVLSELDPRAPPRLLLARSDAATASVIADEGASSMSGFVPRAPSNARELADASGVLRVARRVGGPPANEQKPPMLRVKRPKRGNSIRIGRSVFEAADAPFSFELTAPGPALLPMRIHTDEPLDVVVRVDEDAPRRRTSGVAEHVTRARIIHVASDARAVLFLGDDLAPGKHTLRFQMPEGKRAWVHLPWIAERRPGTHPHEAHWVEGDFEP